MGKFIHSQSKIESTINMVAKPIGPLAIAMRKLVKYYFHSPQYFFSKPVVNDSLFHIQACQLKGNIDFDSTSVGIKRLFSTPSLPRY
jgi:hypothetical protein